jgi:hypothetical protein
LIATIADLCRWPEALASSAWFPELRQRTAVAYPAPAGQAANCFRRAIEIARNQSAESGELPAKTSLAAAARAGRPPREARAMLADIYNWFTAGFGMP